MKTISKPILGLFMGLLASSFTSAEEAPIKVYILSGQSNMVGIGQVDAGGKRWGDEFSNPVLSVYPGKPDPTVNYDDLEAIKTVELEPLGGVHSDPFPGEGVHVVRGRVKMPEAGVYEFRPGYDASTDNIMVVNGKEVHRKEPGGKSKFTPIKLNAGEEVPFKVTYLNDKGNSLGWTARMDVPGTLKSLVNFDGKFQYLTDGDGSFVPRDDVYYKGVVTAGADKWLDIGCGADKNSIGPELGFGHKLGDFHDEPVLILKTSQGNRSLGWDFLPPGSERFEVTDEEGKTWVYAGYKDTQGQWEKGTEPAEGGWYGGKQYDDCIEAAQNVLANFDKSFPHWAGRGYEIAGFGWWQGHKDGGEQGTGSASVHAQQYEKNLIQLMKAMRAEFKAPDAPFVVATVGFNGGEGWEEGSSASTIFNAQMNVANSEKHPELAKSVSSIDTRDFYRAPEISPRDQGFHYNGNAETYMLVGEAMGEAMVKLKK